MTTELERIVMCLRALARAEHDDISIADEAADWIMEMLGEFEELRIHAQFDVIESDIWVCLPSSEWEQVMRRVFCT